MGPITQLPGPWPGAKSFLMWALSVPLTVHGFDLWIKGATTLIGLLSACCGLAVGILGVIYWTNKIKKQSRE